VSALQALCERLKVTASAKYGGAPRREDWPDAHAYLVTLRFQRRRLTVPFYAGSAHCTEPTAADVLACLVSDASAGEVSFQEFCDAMGYDSDSRAAERTWRACARTAPRLRRFLGEHFETVAAAEH
jgi:hypothetical protein